jgi:hypothetical protein
MADVILTHVLPGAVLRTPGLQRLESASIYSTNSPVRASKSTVDESSL